MRIRRALVGPALAAMFVVAGIAPLPSAARAVPARAGAAAWQQPESVKPPNASPTDPAVVTGVACPVADSCAFAGSYRTRDGAAAAFLGTTAGGVTGVKAAPLPGDAATGADAELDLGDVACAGSGDCVAVGAYRTTGSGVQPLIETLAAGTWTPSAVPLPGGAQAGAVQLVDAACNPTECAAIGSYQVVAGQSRGLALVRSDPAGGWQAEDVTLPAGAVTGQGLGVTCAPTGACVGYGTADERPVLVYPSTDTWRAVYLPVPAGVDSTTLDVRGMSCSTSVDCVALGSYGRPDGRGRGVVAEWLRAGVLSVRTVRLPAPLEHRTVTTGAIDCPAAGSCAVLGQLGAPGHPSRAVLFALQGRSWTAALAPQPAGVVSGGSATLASISCPEAGACVAVGAFDSARKVGHVLQRPYAIEQDAGTWTAAGLGLPGGPAGIKSAALFVLSCSGDSCLTAGTDVRYGPQGGVADYRAMVVVRD